MQGAESKRVPRLDGDDTISRYSTKDYSNLSSRACNGLGPSGTVCIKHNYIELPEYTHANSTVYIFISLYSSPLQGILNLFVLSIVIDRLNIEATIEEN